MWVLQLATDGGFKNASAMVYTKGVSLAKQGRQSQAPRTTHMLPTRANTYSAKANGDGINIVLSLTNVHGDIFMRQSVCLPIFSLTMSVLLTCTTLPTQAAEISGVKFADNAEVSGQSLLLNGLGIRYRAIFKVYAAGLYLPKKSQDEKEVLAMTGAKRIHAIMFRDVEGDVLGRLLMQGIRDNSTQQEALRHVASIGKLGQAFAERKKLLAGDSFTIDFDPKLGPQIKVNGKAMTSQPNDPSFNNLFLRIWLGDSPADHLLKKGMLNQPIENKTQY